MGSRVLLADDSVTIQKVVGIIFANEDYELTVVDSGDAAMQKAREIMPDVILVDALMPGKNGYEVCSEIRRDPALSHISLLLMTGAFEVVDEEKSRQSGADEFITKPFESQNLIDITGRLIALSTERKSQAPQTAAPPVPSPQPAAAPQPPPQPAVAAPPVPPAPVAPAPVDDGWGAGFEIEPASEPAQAQAEAAPQPAPVKAATDDDLWGVFDMDAVETAPAAPAAAQSFDPAAAAGDFDAFSFDEAPLTTPAAPAVEEFSFEDETPLETPAKVEYGGASGFEPFGEQEFAIGEEPVTAAPTASANIPLEEDFSTISFDEPQPAPPVPPVQPAAAPVPPPAPPIAPAPPAMEPVPVVAAAVVPEPIAPPPAPQAAAQAATAAIPDSLSEEQLKQLLSKVSRDVIEKIVWEVVPDLAEAIIREEIRKIKEGGR